MAPDVNSLPTSPRKDKDKDGAMPAAQTSQPSSTAASRRESQTMPPPTIPASASPVQHVNNHHLPMSHRSPTMSTNETALPLRHPRPMTAAELYLECEKEQEAVVSFSKISYITNVLTHHFKGQSPHPRTHSLARSNRKRSQQRLPLLNLNRSLAAPSRHLGPQPHSPDDRCHAPDSR